MSLLKLSLYSLPYCAGVYLLYRWITPSETDMKQRFANSPDPYLREKYKKLQWEEKRKKMSNCLLKPLQLTLAIFKPDIVSRPHIVQQIKQMIRNDGFFFVKSTTCYLPRSKAEEFYKEHEGRFFHNRLVTFMSSGHVSAHILAKHDAINCWRKLMGPTKVLKTVHEDPHSIRGKFGLTDTRNATHGSDSEESARREINFFFPDFNIEEWHRTEEPYFRQGKVKFCEDKEIHVIITENEHKLSHE